MKVDIYVFCRHLQGRIGRTAKIEGRIGFLHRLDLLPTVLDTQMLALEIDRLACRQSAPDMEPLIGNFVARIVVVEK